MSGFHDLTVWFQDGPAGFVRVPLVGTERWSGPPAVRAYEIVSRAPAPASVAADPYAFARKNRSAQRWAKKSSDSSSIVLVFVRADHLFGRAPQGDGDNSSVQMDEPRVTASAPRNLEPITSHCAAYESL